MTKKVMGTGLTGREGRLTILVISRRFRNGHGPQILDLTNRQIEKASLVL